MASELQKKPGTHRSPFERIRRTNDVGGEYWSSRDFVGVLGYTDYRNFEAVLEKAKLSCFNAGHRVENHFVDVTEMVKIGSGAERPVKTIFLSRYACYLAIQNADPKKEIVALGQTYFAVQTRRQELTDQRIEEATPLSASGSNCTICFSSNNLNIRPSSGRRPLSMPWPIAIKRGLGACYLPGPRLLHQSQISKNGPETDAINS